MLLLCIISSQKDQWSLLIWARKHLHWFIRCANTEETETRRSPAQQCQSKQKIMRVVKPAAPSWMQLGEAMVTCAAQHVRWYLHRRVVFHVSGFIIDKGCSMSQCANNRQVNTSQLPEKTTWRVMWVHRRHHGNVNDIATVSRKEYLSESLRMFPSTPQQRRRNNYGTFECSLGQNLTEFQVHNSEYLQKLMHNQNMCYHLLYNFKN